MFYSYFKSPIGLVEIGGTASDVTSLNFVESRREKAKSCLVLDRASGQVAEYFAGERQVFDLPISFRGTDFQERVWGQLLKIPFGKTASYQDIARGIGNALAVRAVGAANGKNPISLIVPCHRIIGSNSTLVGYGGGLWRKEWLLKHEGCRFRK
jgi:methylated-DNA-[protein]-cysteine S-methyltransferase